MKSFPSLPLFSIALINTMMLLNGAPVDQTEANFIVGDEEVFVYQPVAPPPATADDACSARFNNIGELCAAAMNVEKPDFKFYEYLNFCQLLKQVNYLENRNFKLLDDQKYTMFVPNNKAIVNLFNVILGTNSIGLARITEFVEFTVIPGEIETRDLECKSKPDALSNLGRNPKIICKTDIAGRPVSYIKGNGNTNQDYIPRFMDPENPIKTCNSNLYLIEDVLLLLKYSTYKP